MSDRIYLDNASTTVLDPRVAAAIRDYWESALGNPSSLHRLGVKAAREVEMARTRIAGRLQARPEEIIFTSGGTEANNLAIRGFCAANRIRGEHLIVSAIEHSSVLAVARWLETQGFRLTILPVDSDGLVSATALERALLPETILVSVMQANNEIGTLQNLAELGSVCAQREVVLHTDACQGFTKVPLDVTAWNVGMATVSAHKIHGPRGVGALYVRRGLALEPLLHGGGQEGGLRSGTLNAEGIVGFGAAVAEARPEDSARMAKLRDRLIQEVLRRVPDTRINGSSVHRLCNNANFSVRGVAAKKLLFELDKVGVSVSAGSACASGSKVPSHVLLALGREEQEAHEALRVSLSRWTTEAEVNAFVECLEKIVMKERQGVHEQTGVG